MKLSALIVSTALFLLFTETETKRPNMPSAVISNERKKVLDSLVYIEGARLEMKMDSIKKLLDEKELQLTIKTTNTNDKRRWLRLRQVK